MSAYKSTTCVPRWTKEEDQILLDLYYTHTQQQIADLIGRSKAAVRDRRIHLGLAGKSHRFSDQELTIIKEWYASHDNATLDGLRLGDLARSM